MISLFLHLSWAKVLSRELLPFLSNVQIQNVQIQQIIMHMVLRANIGFCACLNQAVLFPTRNKICRIQPTKSPKQALSQPCHAVNVQKECSLSHRTNERGGDQAATVEIPQKVARRFLFFLKKVLTNRIRSAKIHPSKAMTKTAQDYSLTESQCLVRTDRRNLAMPITSEPEVRKIRIK